MPVRRSRKGKQGSGAKQAAISAANATTASNIQTSIHDSTTGVGGASTVSRAHVAMTSAQPISSNNVVTCTNIDNNNDDGDSNNKHHQLILTSERRRGVYECDYCGCDVSQTPRIRCAICVDFDVCCDCFITTDPMTAIARLQTAQHALALQQQQQQQHYQPPSSSEWDGPESSSSTFIPPPPPQHDPLTHGYRVCDSTRYPLFPINAAVNASTATANSQNAATSITTNNNSMLSTSRKKKIKTNEEVVTEVFEDSSTMEGVVEYEEAENQEASIVCGNEVKNGKDMITSLGDNSAPGTPAATIEPITMSAGDDNKTIWTIEEDLRLLFGIRTHGLGNWTEISEAIAGHGSTGKTPKRCMERYFDDYMGRYGYILPPYTLIGEATTTSSTTISNNPDTDDDAETTFTSTIGDADPNRKKDSSTATVSTPGATMTTEFAVRSSKRRSTMMRTPGGTSTVPVAKKYIAVPTESLPEYQQIQLEPFLPKLDVGSVAIGQEVGRDQATRAELAYVRAISGLDSKEQVDRIRKDWEANRLNKPGGPTVLPMRPDDVPKLPGSEISGYMPRRGDFDVEYENNAEEAIADMEFVPGESEQDRNLKLSVLAIYHSKLMERNKRKQFIISRKLYDYKSYQEEYRKLPRDERDLVLRMRLFERFHTPEEHKIFIADILKAKRLRKEIAKLQMYRRIGIRTQLEAERYEIDKARRLFHKNAVTQGKDAVSQAEMPLTSGVVTAGSTNGIQAKVSLSSTLIDHESTSSQYWKQYRTTDRKVRRSVNRGVSDEQSTTQSQASNVTIEKSDGNVTTESTNNKNMPTEGLGPMKDKSEDAMAVDDLTTTVPMVESIGNPEQSDKDKEDTLQLENDNVTSNKNHMVIEDESHSPGYHQLSSRELDLIRSIKISPLQYLQIKKVLIYESLQHGLITKNEAGINEGNKGDENNDGRRIRRNVGGTIATGPVTSATSSTTNMNNSLPDHNNSSRNSSNHHTLFLLDIERRGKIIDFILHAGWITTQYGKSVLVSPH